jgi:hypothetical protein
MLVFSSYESHFLATSVHAHAESLHLGNERSNNIDAYIVYSAQSRDTHTQAVEYSILQRG